MPGPNEFHLSGGAWKWTADSGDVDTLPDRSPLAGCTVKFKCNIPSNVPLPVTGGILFVTEREATVGETGQLVDEWGNTGIDLIADDPTFELEAKVQWLITVSPFEHNGRTIRPRPYWVDARAPGESVTIDELTPVPGVQQPGGTRGIRGAGVDLVEREGDDLVAYSLGTEVGRASIADIVDDKVDVTNPLFNAAAIRGAASLPTLGDSLSALNADNATNTFGNSFPTMACFLTGGRFIFAGNFGVPSETVQQIAARVGDVIAVKPSRCLVLAGANSTTKGVAHFNAARAAYETGIIQPLIAAGIEPTLATIPPRDFTRQWAAAGGSQGPGVYQLTLAWNVFVRAMAAKYRLPLCDTYAAVVDPATGNYRDGYTSDNVHWTGPGVLAAARAAADALLNPTVPAVSLERDRYSIINLCASPLFLDGLSAGPGGIYPPGWNGSSSGITTAVVDPVDGDGLDAGKWLRLTKTGSGSPSVNMIRTLSTFAASSGVTVNTGDLVAMGFRYDLDIPVYDPNTYVSIALLFRDGSGTALKTVTPLNQIRHSHRGVMWWETTVPSGTVDVRFNVQFAGGAATLELGEMTIYDLTAMGCPPLSAVDQPLPASSLTVPPDPVNPVPQKPVLAAGTPTAGTIPYSITPGGGAAPTSYQVEFSLPENYGTWTSGGGSGATGAVTGLANNQPYWLRARGVNAGGAGPWSDYVQTATALADAPPAQVTGLTAGTATGTTQPLAWDAAALTTGYPVQYKRSIDSTWTTFGTVTGTAVTVTGLTPGTSYDYRVAAQNNAGTGPYSSTVTASTAAAATVLASDSFNRANSSTLGALDYAQGGSVTGLTWANTGQLQIIDNQVGGTVSTTRWATVDLGVTDGYCEAEMAAVDGGVVGRYTDTTSYYQFRYVSTTGILILEKRFGGATNVLWSSSAGVFTPGPGQKIGIDCHGTTIGAYVNGVLVQAVTDTSITTGTRWGMRSGANSTAFRLDNWLAKTAAA
jgi:hypothetical protein